MPKYHEDRIDKNYIEFRCISKKIEVPILTAVIIINFIETLRVEYGGKKMYYMINLRS